MDTGKDSKNLVFPLEPVEFAGCLVRRVPTKTRARRLSVLLEVSRDGVCFGFAESSMDHFGFWRVRSRRGSGYSLERKLFDTWEEVVQYLATKFGQTQE